MNQKNRSRHPLPDMPESEGLFDAVFRRPWAKAVNKQALEFEHELREAGHQIVLQEARHKVEYLRAHNEVLEAAREVQFNEYDLQFLHNLSHLPYLEAELALRFDLMVQGLLAERGYVRQCVRQGVRPVAAALPDRQPPTIAPGEDEEEPEEPEPVPAVPPPPAPKPPTVLEIDYSDDDINRLAIRAVARAVSMSAELETVFWEEWESDQRATLPDYVAIDVIRRAKELRRIAK